MINWLTTFCIQGHQMKWTKQYIQKCAQCGPTQNMCRYMCTECDQYYCVKCMPPPIMGDYCGGGHEIKYIPKLNFHSCDVCRASITGGAHRCDKCDYDVCDNCWIVKED